MEKQLTTRKTISQKSQIRAWLESGKAINPMIALKEFGCFRLGARIWDLRDEGMTISTTMIDNGKGASYAEYRMEL